MSDLPPDARRLREILRYLDGLDVDNQTLLTYLKVQRAAVEKALAEAESAEPGRPEDGRQAPGGKPSSRPPGAVIPTAPRDPRRPGKPYKLERRKTSDGPVPTAVHTADCHMAGELTHAVNAMEARLALTDSGLPACRFCRPDLELGIDQD
ncbi:DUF6233 domain-containing protein [Streptomyces chartreusis]|uniref:DUF6233 domain-containing protein n=1 Tax=Streptomyces chartreusis TaxID=1969 RepID=UPI003427C619